MKTKTLLAATITAALASSVLLAPPAGAAISEYEVWNDPVGDGPAGADITSVKVVQGDGFTTKVQGLADAGTLDFSFNNDDSRVRVTKTAGHAPTFTTYERPYDSSTGTVGPWQVSTTCKPGGGWDPAAGTVLLTLPGEACGNEFLYEGGALSATMTTADGSDAIDLDRVPDASGRFGSETFKDRLYDAPRRVDIKSATITFTSDKQWVVTRVRDLRSHGRFRSFFTGDREFEARVVVTKKTGYAPKATLVYRDEPYDGQWSDWYHVRCAIQVRWNRTTDLVNVGIPLTCKHLDDTLWRVDDTVDGATDHADRY